MRYANNSNYKNDTIIKKECFVTEAVLQEVKRIIEDSEVCRGCAADGGGGVTALFFSSWFLHSYSHNLQILKEDDANWPEADRVGRQELEVIIGDEHISFATTKLGSLLQVQQSDDPEGLRVFYYLVQVCLVQVLVEHRVRNRCARPQPIPLQPTGPQVPCLFIDWCTL